MKDYIFIMKKYDIDCDDILRKALYFKDIDSYFMSQSKKSQI